MSERTRLLATSVIALLAGALVGLLTTLIHQAVLYAGPIPLPWGMLLALALSATFLIGVRLRFESRWPAISAAIGYVFVCGLALMKTPNDSLLVLGNLWGTIWALAPGVLAVVIVAWPRLKRSSQAATN